mmetsp:Transcript_25091/g.84125  ORF Transcript_25091/g.84125 Transcript_25091/m.84125 type:complete len:201 (-) Transcript_25091:213-815(-)
MSSTRFFLLGLIAPAVVDAFTGSAASQALVGASHVQRSALRAGLFDGVKDAFKNPVAPQGDDRVTPIDRWLGIDKDLTVERPKKTFVDPQDGANYFSVALSKPMGIRFLENEGDCGGIVVEGVLPEGSASSTKADITPGDQLVAVGDKLVMGLDFDTALSAIQDASDEKVQLVFFRGSQDFLYGPTQPSEAWLRESVLAH